MLHLTAITDTADVVFHECIDPVEDVAFRGRLINIKPQIKQHDADFATAAKSSRFCDLSEHTDVGGTVTKAEMEWVYNNRLVGGARGRVFYDKIMALAKHRRCPLCAHGRVASLDHYLPKAKFPGLAVCPNNLLPACTDCNKAKLAAVPKCASEQSLNPYYDNIENDVWLQAKFDAKKSLVVKFSVVKPKAWPALLAMRVRHHFSEFHLGQMYSEQAALELEDIKTRLTKLLNDCGPNDVRDHLLEEAEGRGAANKNSWRAALYRMLAANKWFCREGCKG